MPQRGPKAPDWDQLYEQAEAQAGYFDTQQALGAGFSAPLLTHHAQSGRIRRVLRGVFRLSHFPRSEHENLVTFWLWSHQKGVFSHETALMLHGLSDAMPSRLDMTLPAEWRTRRLKIPEELIVHYADVPPTDRTWLGPVPLTTPARAILDCQREGAPREIVDLAFRQISHRGLLAPRDLRALRRSLTRLPSGREQQQDPRVRNA